MRAFARVIGFPDSFHLYQDQSESAAALASSTFPVTFALTFSIALLACGINIISSPTSPITQIILRAVPTYQVPELSLFSKLCMLGTTKSLAQLITRHTQTHATEITRVLITHGVTSTESLSQVCSTTDFISSSAPHLQHGILLIASHARNSQPTSSDHSPHNIHLPNHLISTFYNYSQSQQNRFLKYISPLLTPPHPLTQGIPRAYFQITHQHEPLMQIPQLSVLHLSICLAAIQDTAAKIILYLIPPFVPIELLHRTICIIFLKNTSPQCFNTTHTSRITTRTLLGRF